MTYQLFDQNFVSIHFLPTNNVLGQGPNVILKQMQTIWSPLFKNVNNPLLERSFKIGGYFKYQVNEVVTVISLNTLYFMIENDAVLDCIPMDLYFPPRYSPNSTIDVPGDEQLNWLIDILESDQSMHFIIIGHIPPQGSENNVLYHPICYNNFVSILGYYSKRIIGNFVTFVDFSLDILTRMWSMFC